MNYLKIYNNLIEKAKKENNKEDEYYEIHHIVPKSLNGTNDESNLVKMTFRQHYVAHELLVKIYPNCKQLIHALWMMTITTMNALNKNDETVDNRIKQRIISLKNNERTLNYISSRAYEKCKTIYKKMMKGHLVSDETRRLISIKTREGMKNPTAIKNVKERCAAGSKNTRWYYDRITLKCFKKFEGDPEIDLTKYTYGRPTMSKTQRERLSAVKSLNKKCYHNDDYKLSFWLYYDYFKNFDESLNWKEKKKEYRLNLKFRQIIFSLRQELIQNDVFGFEKFFFHPTELSRCKIVFNPGLYEFCSSLLKNWYDNENFKNDLKLFIKENEDKIDYYVKKYEIKK